MTEDERRRTKAGPAFVVRPSSFVVVGTSGWVYGHWRGRFYPEELPAADWLAFYCRHFPTVEINRSFYRLPSRAAFEHWRESVPPEFCFAVKASRFITHMKKLKDPAEPVDRLFEAAEGLGPKLGPVLFQFPAKWQRNAERLAAFLTHLPSTHRYTFEFRHPSWLDAEIYDLLRRYRCALCIPDHPDMPRAFEFTADFTYLRFHAGSDDGCYTEAELKTWARRLREFQAMGLAVFAYFNNDWQAYAVQNALRLGELVG